MRLVNLKSIENKFGKWKENKTDKQLSCIQPRNLAKDLDIQENDTDDFLSLLVERNEALRVFTGICPNPECEEEFFIDSCNIEEKYECEICGTSFKLSDSEVDDVEVYYELIQQGIGNRVISTSPNYKDKYFSRKLTKDGEEVKKIEYSNEKKVIHIPTKSNIENKNNDNKEFSIFISHNEKDSKLAEIVIELLENLGVSKSVKDGKVFCSSANNRGVSIGDDIFEEIRNKFNDDIIVVFLFTERFFESPACLCEMGATWVKAKYTVPLVMPPQKFEDIRGIFNKNIKGFMLDDEKKFTELVDYFMGKFNLKNIDFKEYEKIKNSFFEKINNFIAKN